MRPTVLVLAALALLGGCDDDPAGPAPGNDRTVVLFNGIPYGDTCASDDACGGEPDSCCLGGKCSPEGWCSPICATDADCPDEFHCVSHSGTRCFLACVDDGDCPYEFICEDKDGYSTCRYK